MTSTPTEWNVEMVNDKVIVTLSGEENKFEEKKKRLRTPVGMCTGFENGHGISVSVGCRLFFFAGRKDLKMSWNMYR